VTLGSAGALLPCPAATRPGIQFVVVGLWDPPRPEDSTALATLAADTEGDMEHEPAEPAVPADGPLVGGDTEKPSFLLKLLYIYPWLSYFFIVFFVRGDHDYYFLIFNF
jgi:hypothetical protein